MEWTFEIRKFWRFLILLYVVRGDKLDFFFQKKAASTCIFSLIITDGVSITITKFRPIYLLIQNIIHLFTNHLFTKFSFPFDEPLLSIDHYWIWFRFDKFNSKNNNLMFEIKIHTTFSLIIWQTKAKPPPHTLTFTCEQVIL